MTNRLTGTAIAQISLLRTTTRVIERHTLHSTLAFINLGTTVVAYKDRLSCHEITSTIADD
jgi:hypothetical protein